VARASGWLRGLYKRQTEPEIVPHSVIRKQHEIVVRERRDAGRWL
jgi:hypothetical protein